MSLLPSLEDEDGRVAVRFPDGALTRGELDRAAAAVGAELPPEGPVALWATPHTATVIGLVAALRAGLAVALIDPKTGAAEIDRMLAVSRPRVALAPDAVDAGGLPVISPMARGGAGAGPPLEDRSAESSLIVFTSGTTGPA